MLGNGTDSSCHHSRREQRRCVVGDASVNEEGCVSQEKLCSKTRKNALLVFFFCFFFTTLQETCRKPTARRREGAVLGDVCVIDE